MLEMIAMINPIDATPTTMTRIIRNIWMVRPHVGGFDLIAVLFPNTHADAGHVPSSDVYGIHASPYMHPVSL